MGNWLCLLFGSIFPASICSFTFFGSRLALCFVLAFHVFFVLGLYMLAGEVRICGIWKVIILGGV